MKRLFTSAVLTVAAVPFLVAAPAKQAQTAAPSDQAQTTTKTHKKHVKKAKHAKGGSENAAANTSSEAK
jgi:hypothetical protein